MILEVTYEGKGIFKVYPPPTEFDSKEIIEKIKGEKSAQEIEEIENSAQGLSDRNEELEDENLELEKRVKKLESTIEKVKELFEEVEE